jgi:hypothetical protein
MPEAQLEHYQSSSSRFRCLPSTFFTISILSYLPMPVLAFAHHAKSSRQLVQEIQEIHLRNIIPLMVQYDY